MYMVTQSNLKSVLQASASHKQKAAAPNAEQAPKETSDDGFREQRRRKRNTLTNTNIQQPDMKKTMDQTAVQMTAQNMK
jgi:hypothetical protein